MKYVPFVARVDAWKSSFATDKTTRHPGTRRRWLVNQKGGGREDGVIQLVTPTQQAVERAQSEIKELRKRGAPIEKYAVKRPKKVKTNKKGKSKKLPKFA